MTKTYHEELVYGEKLSIRLSVGSEKLQFTSVNETKQDVLWSRFSAPKRGIVTGKLMSNYRKFIIRSITFDNQGTYRNIKMCIHLLKVICK